MSRDQDPTTQSSSSLFGERESAAKTRLDGTLPVIVRVDGVRFSTYTRHLQAPADESFIEAMNAAAKAIAKQIPQVEYVFVQSDEVNVLIRPSETGDLPYGGGVQKLASICASVASTAFNAQRILDDGDHMAVFDGRAFNIHPDEAGRYFRWRQQVGWANSMTMTAGVWYSHKRLDRISVPHRRALIGAIGEDPDFTPHGFRHGRHLYLEMTSGVSEFTNTKTGETGTAEFNRLKPVFGDAPERGIAEFVDSKARLRPGTREE
ncbi:tRNA(His) guanylyltransferase Thg1 family protein [Agromyces sp. NPDC057679]|uniref:tRNA(His) guanylyltransferase Thg1 family protein n=1 Tax=Agromyces sp. NPDC057679 TaxID=3346207 RepID=UPI00366E46F4